jgi:UDPglucose--hexose-1-phosphate uridylyltransferase
MSQNEIRKDYLQDKYVLIAPQRSDRPHDIERHEKLNHHDKRKSCVFCPASVNNKTDLLTVGPKDRWYTKVISNRYPAVSTSNPNAYGIQEIVIETPNHLLEMEDLPEEHLVKIFETYDQRTREISKDPNIQYILTFKNNGGRAGASLSHAHSQIFATAFLPPHLADKSSKALAYRLEHGTCVYCDVIAKERLGVRHVWEDDNILAFTPYASFHNYEVWIMPKRHLDNVTNLNAEERTSAAFILKRLLRGIGDLHLPYNFYFHQVVRDTDQHLYIKLTPRGSVWAGVELGTGLVINPVTPEAAAHYYKNVVKKD